MRLKELEQGINNLLIKEFEKYKADHGMVSHFNNLNKNEVNAGFYEQNFEESGKSPGDREPNKAHMKLAEHFWDIILGLINANGINCLQALRHLFRTSIEYEGDNYDIRIFSGILT